MNREALPEGYDEMLRFGLIDALLGRRSRRFFVGAKIPDGVFSFSSNREPIPLTDLEKLLILTACGGNTGWHYMHIRAESYKPSLSNYSASAGGRTFPSGAGFHTSKTFFTDDEGVYVLDNRDAPSNVRNDDGSLDLPMILDSVKRSIRKLQDNRLQIPPEPPYIEPHNTWVANRPGSFLVIPVADVAQHVLLSLCYLLQNGIVIKDDINGRSIPGMERFKGIADSNNTIPLTLLDQMALMEASAELSTSCYAGALMLQAMGLGGWMFDGIDPFTVLGASGNPAAPGLRFRFDTNERWPYPNPTGLEGVMEGFCPPHYPDMKNAVEAVTKRKFGPGGPFHPDTPGPWKETSKVRSAAQVHSEEFKDCVALQAQYLLDAFGKFPATVPSTMCMIYLQAHHLDLEFYDHFFEPGAYLRTHANHLKIWH